MKIAQIYLLIEKMSQAPLYVGKSVNLSFRFSRHSRYWLEVHGLEIEMIIIENCSRPWQEAEIEWIAFFRSFCKIENKLDGGDEFRKSRVWTPEDSSKGAKTANANRKGKKRPNHSSKMKGRKPSISALSASKSPEAIAKRMVTMKENGNYGRSGRLNKGKTNSKNKALIEERKRVRDELNVSWAEAVQIVKQRKDQ